jgi:ubiquinone biosynthesis protein Coq4
MNDQTPGEVLSKFYAENNLDQDGGQSSSSVRIEVNSRLHFYFPNFDARRKAVIKHDIHHLLTGYSTNVSGESEISAWEIGSGCKKYWAAFLIDTSGVMMGIPFNLWNVIKAFSRGRRTRNLYNDSISTEKALDMKISKLREHLLLDKVLMDTKPNLADLVLFGAFTLFGALYSIVSLPLLPFVIIYSIYIRVKASVASAGHKL